MLTIRWDTVMIVAVIGLSVIYLLVLASLRIGAARLIRSWVVARTADAPNRHALPADQRRHAAPPSRHLALYHDDEADVTPRTPQRRQLR